MLAKATYSLYSMFFTCRIYRFLLAVVLICAYCQELFSQETGAFKTIQSGNFTNLSTWNIYDGSSWNAATFIPGPSNDIYIDQNHTLTLIGNESVKSVYINAETGAAIKLNLNSHSLSIYGSLNAFSGAAPGTPSGSWNSQNWIGNSITSKLIFKGSSRIIIFKDSWSGFTTNSRYSIEFDPGDGVILEVEEPIKALNFIIKSGTVLQKIDNSVIPATCATFSFNNESINGTGAFGDFTIEADATLISQCNDGIIFRSGISGTPNSAANFILEDDGQLILEGTSPQIEAANFTLDGQVIFNNDDFTQNFLSSSYLGSDNPTAFHDIEIQGSQDLVLPTFLEVSGDLKKSGSGNFLMSSTEIEFSGPHNQQVQGFSMNVGELEINKSGGTVTFEEDLYVLGNFIQASGTLDLQGNELSINSSLTGELDYSGGSWSDISQFTYFGVPPILTASNGTFPFADQFQGGVRKVQLLGANTGGNLKINFIEYKGVDFNPSFNDSDATPILYRLFSYFQFSGLNPSSLPLELRISADKLIVDDVDDLRIVGTGYAAPGSHLAGLDPVELWARRELSADELSGVNFTVGSYRTLSILPLIWISTKAISKQRYNRIYWEIANENSIQQFEIYRYSYSLNDSTFIGRITAENNTSNQSKFEFKDQDLLPSGEIYYQLKGIDTKGKESWSKVFRLEGKRELETQIKLFPNPYDGSTPITLVIPHAIRSSDMHISIASFLGEHISTFPYQEEAFANEVNQLSPGIYMIYLQAEGQAYQVKLLKK